jgi:predicted nucleic acid-binding protein
VILVDTSVWIDHLLGNLPRVPVASDAEALHLIERRALMGRGIGYIDVHLLAAVASRGGPIQGTRVEAEGR